MKLKKTQLFYLVIKLIKPSLYHGLVRDEKLREASVSYFLVRRITLLLSRISSEPLMSLGNKHNYKTFPKSPPASLLHCIGNILSRSSGKWRDSLTMVPLSFTSGCSKFHLVQYLFTNISLYLLISPKQQRNYQREEKMIPIPLLVFHLVQAFGTVKRYFYLITNKNKRVSFKFTKFILYSEL